MPASKQQRNCERNSLPPSRLPPALVASRIRWTPTPCDPRGWKLETGEFYIQAAPVGRLLLPGVRFSNIYPRQSVPASLHTEEHRECSRGEHFVWLALATPKGCKGRGIRLAPSFAIRSTEKGVAIDAMQRMNHDKNMRCMR